MPPRKIEINDVERRNTNRVQGHVIVDQLPAKVGEITSQLKRFRGGKNIARHLSRGIRGKRDAERPVANHVEQEPAAKLFRAGALQLPGKIAAPVQTISLRELLDSFLAIKKHELNFPGQIRMLSDHPG